MTCRGISKYVCVYKKRNEYDITDNGHNIDVHEEIAEIIGRQNAINNISVRFNGRETKKIFFSPFRYNIILYIIGGREISAVKTEFRCFNTILFREHMQPYSPGLFDVVRVRMA